MVPQNPNKTSIPKNFELIDFRKIHFQEILNDYLGKVYYNGTNELAWNISLFDMTQTPVLIFYSIPKNIEEFRYIIQIANSTKIILNFEHEIEYDFQKIITDLFNSIKYNVKNKNNVMKLSQLSEIIGLEETSVVTALSYLREYGKISFNIDYDNEEIYIEKGSGIKNNPVPYEKLLLSIIQEKMAFIRYIKNVELDELFKIL
jgi:hypothetical protein